MTLKEKLAKAKLINKYTTERETYCFLAIDGVRRGGNTRSGSEYFEFYMSKALDLQMKLDALNELERSV
mgnify:FL=1